ncbi:MAG: adenosylcobalamin-dependent ribonucleoside-diphosphate reductase [Phycisphaeraceae bacterium]|nr:adenosylcobalamin-dependent ribonucleoside-diphosphate reductase [Phycisphaeraceae bacterium]
MKISRRFTTRGQDPFETTEWTTRTSRISNADGSLVFEMKDAEVPAGWSQLATDIMVSKYFRKAGVPQIGPDGAPQRDAAGAVVTGPERSARQVIHRLVGCWRHWGEQNGYFDSAEDAHAFADELTYMLVHQMAAPNSPQWFNTGLHWAYGISGPAQGHWINDRATGLPCLADDAYSHPQPHACFIQSVTDDLVNPGGIMDLWVREARLFKYGSGTGTNFSRLRGENEPLSGGGRSSGLMSFLRIGDRAAGAIKSGGTTRRAAKMVCLDADHPDIEQFVNWKVREELKVQAMVQGYRLYTPEQREIADRLGLVLDYDFNGESYQTVSGQNSNNSVRLSDAFFAAVDEDRPWQLIRRIDGRVAREIPARDLWSQICYAAWRCADPGLQFDTTINAWHTCPSGGRINASNPCSEYMFLDDTACNLASLNLLRFYDASARHFDLDLFEHAVELWTMVLEISVLMASFPSEEIARLSHDYRTLGLGYANLGAMLMQAGIPYDSEEGRAVCAAITAVMTGRSYAASALLAAEHGPFAGFGANRQAMMRVVRNHRRAAHGVARDAAEYEDLHIRPVPIDHGLFSRGAVGLSNAAELLTRACRAWDDALELGERHGYRNAQVTVIAPTGTIGLLMDCDTTGVEPDFALVKFKKLAGGGYFKIANASLAPALRTLGYADDQIDDILRAVLGTLSLDAPMPGGAPGTTFRAFLEAAGYRPEDLAAVEAALPTVFDIRFAFNAWSMPEAVLRSVGVVPEDARKDPSFSGLRALGLPERDIETLGRMICGTQTVEGAPWLREEHLVVFDCANRCGPTGRRFIRPEGHIRMMAAAQPFISGAISKTINFPNESTVEDVERAYRLSWQLGLKANALYRDGSKLSQPLSSKTDAALDDAEQDEDGEAALRADVSDDVARLADVIGREAHGAAALDDEEPRVEYVERVVERIIERPMRRRLPDTRSSITHRFNVAGHEGYLTVGLYDDGHPGELFITMSKEGSTIGGLMDSLGTAISVALQYGVPVEDLVNKFAHQRFEPMGLTTNRDIPFAKSLVDYIFRWLGMEFIPGYREQNSPQRGESSRSASGAAASPGPRSGPGVTGSGSGSAVGHGMAEAGMSGSGLSGRVMEDFTRWNTGDMPPASDRMGRMLPGPGSDGWSARSAPMARATPERTAAPSPSTARTPEITTRSVDVGTVVTAEVTTLLQYTSISQAAASMQSDAPACDQCGEITVRSGQCYKCLNCGNSLGCS